MAHRILGLITEVSAAVAKASTRPVLARRTAEALALHLPLVVLDVGWCTTVGEAEVVRALWTGAEFETSQGSLRLGGAIGKSLASRMPLVVDARRLELEPPPPGKRFVVLPLVESGTLGFVLLGLEGKLDADLSEPEALLALAATLRGPHHGCGTIARVAEASRRAHVENRALKAQLVGLAAPLDLVARSQAMREALARADLVAPHDTAVLITGESGTGKGVLARRLHARSARAEGPFVAVNCGAIPEGLVDSDLFGHEAGAFTGALKRHVGRFQRARGGTLLLDEVGELPLATQARLLRVLQEGEFEPVGSERTLRADVRIVAATHRPLRALVADGRFREDLYYRLDVFRLALPPLRERADDLPELATTLASRVSVKLGLPPLPIAPEAMVRILAHPWPGNVRELENLLERARLLARGRSIDAAALDEAGLEHAPRPWVEAPPAGGAMPQPWVGVPTHASFADQVRAILERALTTTEGKIGGEDGAAALLGLKPTTLQAKLRLCGVDRKAFVRRKR